MTRMQVGLVAVALVGCAADVELDAEDLGTTEVAIGTRCPNPDECGLGNGGGSYAEEFGQIGVGIDHPNWDRLMLTHFINSPGPVAGYGDDGVGAEARLWDHVSYDFSIVPVTIDSVKYNGATGVGGVPYKLASVTEYLTKPTFRIRYGSNVLPDITGDDPVVNHLELHLSWKDNTAGAWIRFVSNGTQGNLNVLGMQWTRNGSPWTTYCRTAPADPTMPESSTNLRSNDMVVFQQDIIVNPLTTDMSRNPNYVTLSCSKGAPATVRSWGYAYRTNEVNAAAFEIAMHMKRASYCGDSTFYTVPGNFILYLDSYLNPATGMYEHVNSIMGYDNEHSLATQFEAVWGLDASGHGRALCFTESKLREPGIEFPPTQWMTPGGGAPFVDPITHTATCADGTVIPPCSNYGEIISVPAPGNLRIANLP